MVAFPDLLAWRAVNGKSETELRTLCASDSQCQGYYTCTNTTDCAARMYKKHDALGLSTTRPFDVSPTSAMLLKSVTDGSSMLNDADFVVHSRAIPTCEGTAGGAPCAFPFTTDYNARQRQTVVEFFEPTLVGRVPAEPSTRPWCYTSKPGLWGYADCYGEDPLGFRWEISEWSNCSRKCERGGQTRSAICVNTTSY